MTGKLTIIIYLGHKYFPEISCYVVTLNSDLVNTCSVLMDAQVGKEFVSQARSAERQWSKALQHERSLRTQLEENLEVIAKQMQSLESEAIVWQESTPPQLDLTTTIGMDSGDSSAAYPSHDGHMTSTPGSDDGHMTSTPGSDDGHMTFPQVGGALTYAISTYYHIVGHYVVCQQCIVRGWG